MPREDQHRTKAEKNEAFARTISTADATSEAWAVVVAFYSALHYVESYLAKYGVHAGNHQDRFREIMRDDRIKPAYTSYKFLYDMSRLARYSYDGLPPQPYSKAKPQLEAVRRQIEFALGEQP